MGPEFIFITLLSLGRFSTERELLLNDTLRGCFRNTKLIGKEDDPESLQNYSNQVMNVLSIISLCFSKWSTYDLRWIYIGYRHHW